MPTDDLHDALGGVAERLDFGEYESRAYLAVLEHGDLTASELAERADVPQPRVYDTVRALDEAGLVELRESRPLRVLAVDPEAAFADLRASLDDLVADLDAVYTRPARGAEAATLVQSRATLLRRLADAVTAAEYELALSLTPDLLAHVEDDLRDRRDAGVAVDLLLSPASEVPDGDAFDYGALASAVRARRGVTTPVLAVADGDYALYAPRDAFAADSRRERYGVVFDRSTLGFLVSGFYDALLWTTAEPVAGRDDGRSFPRRYATIRRCVADLRDADGTFYATIEGRDVVTGERRTVRGRVADVARADTRETASLVLRTDDGEVRVGGRLAALEDVEAHEIHVGEDEPPEA